MFRWLIEAALFLIVMGGLYYLIVMGALYYCYKTWFLDEKGDEEKEKEERPHDTPKCH